MEGGGGLRNRVWELGREAGVRGREMGLCTQRSGTGNRGQEQCVCTQECMRVFVRVHMHICTCVCASAGMCDLQGWGWRAGVRLLLWKRIPVAVMEEGQEGWARGLSASLWPPRGPAGFGGPSATVVPFLVQTSYLLELSSSSLIRGRQAPPRCFLLGVTSRFV